MHVCAERIGSWGYTLAEDYSPNTEYLERKYMRNNFKKEVFKPAINNDSF